jgi:hypothetical protein
MWETPVEWIDAEKYQSLSAVEQQNIKNIVHEYSIKWLMWLCSLKVIQLLQLWVIKDDFREDFEWVLD